MSPERSIILLSGGMDSVTALYWAKARMEVVAAISFDYGAKHNARELPFAKIHCDRLEIPHQIVKLAFFKQFSNSHLLQGGGAIPEGEYCEETIQLTSVPFRNGIMLSIAAGFAECQKATQLIIAAHNGSHAIYPDCSEEFMAPMSAAIRAGTYAQISIVRPFIHDYKEDIARKGTELGVDYQLTWSCYQGREKHCGKCSTCLERKLAFANAHLTDPTEYEA